MMTSELEQLRQIRIHKLLGIKDTGRRVSVRCPFHSDGTPSLTIYKDNSYHCFGCQANGQNAIDFLIQAGLSFTEAVEELKQL